MDLPVIQFYHPHRPWIDWREQGRIIPCDVSTYTPENRSLVAIKAMAARHPNAPGLIILERDIAIDPRHLDEITTLVADNPVRIVAVDYLVWPVSTGRKVPMWVHTRLLPNGEREIHAPPDPPLLHPNQFGLGCTYLPRVLVERAPDTEQDWDYLHLDQRFSEMAERLRIHMVVTETPAIHLHW